MIQTIWESHIGSFFSFALGQNSDTRISGFFTLKREDYENHFVGKAAGKFLSFWSFRFQKFQFLLKTLYT